MCQGTNNCAVFPLKTKYSLLFQCQMITHSQHLMGPFFWSLLSGCVGFLTFWCITCSRCTFKKQQQRAVNWFLMHLYVILDCWVYTYKQGFEKRNGCCQMSYYIQRDVLIKFPGLSRSGKNNTIKSMYIRIPVQVVETKINKIM